MAVTALAWPNQSNEAARRGDGATRRRSSSAAAATGRFTKKMSRQLTRVSTPPRTGPDDDATAPPIAHIATARPRWRCSGYAWPIKAIDAGIITAAAEPWTNRAATSSASVGAKPHAADATAKRLRPKAKIRRAPARSVSAPDHKSSAANISV